MQHPDEGTIHAWLDGALDEREASDMAAHVAACAECAERVREARGLIAGASRIVAATDWGVGAGVPAGEARATAGARVRTPRRWRPWVTPLRSVAAAVLIVAASTLVVTREVGKGTLPARTAASPGARPPVPPSISAAPAAPSAPAARAAKVAKPAQAAAAEQPAPAAAAPSADVAEQRAPAAMPNEKVAGRADSIAADARRGDSIVVDARRADAVRALVEMRPTRALREVGAASRAAAGGVALEQAVVALPRCYEVVSDSAMAFVPSRLVLAPNGRVLPAEQAGERAAPMSWRGAGAGAVDVLLRPDSTATLRITDRSGSVSGLLRQGRVEVPLALRRCR